MNPSHNSRIGSHHLAAGVKIAALISVLGLIAIIADRELVTPTEIPLAGANFPVAPYEATSSSADGSVMVAEPPMPFADRPGRERQATAAVPGSYPELAKDAVRDEGGHPPSF